MSTLRNFLTAIAVSGIGLIAQASAQTTSGAGALAPANPIFKIVKTPNPNQPFPANNYLDAVSASSMNDIWAVGAIAIHFDGTQWAGASVPDMEGTGTSILTGVANISPTNVWAVGYINFNVAGAEPASVVEHFNGTSWSLFTSPQFPAPDQAFLRSITAISPTDIWAGGSLFQDPYLFPLLEHFDGTSWTRVSPNMVGCGI